LQTRTLGRSGIQVSAMGLGTWAIGGPWSGPDGGIARGWGEIDDDEVIRAIQYAQDRGITFFDTSNNYGCGHAENLLGKALAGHRDQVVIATKFGYICKENVRQVIGSDASAGAIRRSCEGSLRRLNTDHIDLYQLHIYNCDPEQAIQVRETLEALVKEGKIRCYGWSTGDPERARVFAEGPNCAAVQYNYNVLERNEAMLSLCQAFNLASIARGPLCMGLLTGKYNHHTTMPKDDVRYDWDLEHGREAKQLEMLESIRKVLTQDGRTLAQAALGWLWARGAQVIPIPGFKNLKQVQENIGALQFGPLSGEQVREIDEILEL
jgi:aryl-alcohol dehydrogenase-like predicted oxidoreductase